MGSTLQHHSKSKRFSTKVKEEVKEKSGYLSSHENAFLIKSSFLRVVRVTVINLESFAIFSNHEFQKCK